MSDVIRILLIDDDEDEFVLIRALLQEAPPGPHVLHWTGVYEEARAAFHRQEHDVYLLDFRLGAHSGVDLLKEVLEEGCKSPIILLTGRPQEDTDLVALRCGAADYLAKSQLTAPLLQRAIRYAIERRRTECYLRQAQKMEAIGRLAGGVAHDLNNLMTVVLGYGDLLLHKFAADDGVVQMLTEITKAGERSASLTRQLLAFSRKQQFSLKVLDPNALISEVSRMLTRLIGEDVHLKTELASDLAHIRADPVQIEQVLMNLAINARDAMPTGGDLIIRTHETLLDKTNLGRRRGLVPGHYVTIDVADTGTGMDQSVLAHMFEPFFTTKEAGKGTGMGLATVYGIVKQTGGYVYADSCLGKGTTFTIYFPAVRGEVDAAPPVAEEPRTKGTETVLLVEDEPAVRRLMADMLCSEGYSTLRAADGQSALRVARSHAGAIDLLVTDMIMPDMAGPELAERLHRMRPDIRALFVSGYATEIVRSRTSLGGHPVEIGFLHKPFTSDVFAKKIREVLQRRALV